MHAEGCLLHYAASQGRLELIKIVLAKYPNLMNQSDRYNNTPLLWAAHKGQAGVVRYLISQGADLNTTTNCPGNPHHGKTTLHRAVDEDHKTTVDCLIKAGAHIDALLLKNPKFHAYLVSVIENNHLALVHRLAKNKTTLTTPMDGMACLIHLAAKKGRLEVDPTS